MCIHIHIFYIAIQHYTIHTHFAHKSGEKKNGERRRRRRQQRHQQQQREPSHCPTNTQTNEVRIENRRTHTHTHSHGSVKKKENGNTKNKHFETHKKTPDDAQIKINHITKYTHTY